MSISEAIVIGFGIDHFGKRVVIYARCKEVDSRKTAEDE